VNNFCFFSRHFHFALFYFHQAPAVDIIAISSSTSPDADDNKPYEDDRDFDVVYAADKILGERSRPINAEHSGMCDVKVGTVCTHYLVKWAGYPTSNSTWTPATLCSKSLVDVYVQQKSSTQESLFLIPSRENRARRFDEGLCFGSDLDDDDLSIVIAPLPPIVTAVQPPPRFPILPALSPVTVSDDDVLIARAVPPSLIPPLDDGAVLPRKVKKANCIQVDACMLEAQSLDALKCRVTECNSDCAVRIRGRDRKKGGGHSVRLSCKRVDGAMPCSLQIYCDENADGLTSNIR
jgi:hypothetical protein